MLHPMCRKVGKKKIEKIFLVLCPGKPSESSTFFFFCHLHNPGNNKNDPQDIEDIIDRAGIASKDGASEKHTQREKDRTGNNIAHAFFHKNLSPFGMIRIKSIRCEIISPHTSIVKY